MSEILKTGMDYVIASNEADFDPFGFKATQREIEALELETKATKAKTEATLAQVIVGFMARGPAMKPECLSLIINEADLLKIQ